MKFNKIFLTTFFILLLTSILAFAYFFVLVPKLSQSALNTNEKTQNWPLTKQDSVFQFQNPGTQENKIVENKNIISPNNLPAKFKMTWNHFLGSTSINNYTSSESISFPTPEKYSLVEGITTFRGNNYRNSAFYGSLDVKDSKLEVVWSKRIGSINSWTGVGWNGQPSIVKWDDKVKAVMNIVPAKKSKNNLKEVIYATMDGNIYFLDLDDGEKTRPEIVVGYPHKGSVCVDPRGFPLLYAGQGIGDEELTEASNTKTTDKPNKKSEFGYRIFNLIDQKRLFFIDGLDPLSFRYWGAFDSVSLVDAKTDTLFECGENGLFYKIKLNSNFDVSKGTIAIDPKVTKYRYSVPGRTTTGTENSMAIYKNFAYYTDNSGFLQCLDINTLKPVWAADVTDDSDSTIAIDEEFDTAVSLYTACEVDLQGDKGYSYVRKFNALNGQLLWEKAIKCKFDSYTNGGALGSPIVGKQEIDNLVIYNIAKTDDSNSGKLIAFDKKTGQEIWIVNLRNYGWSSPVAVYSKNGKSYIVLCDSVGNMNLYEGKSGRLLDTISLESNIEGSPAIYDNMIVVGTRGQKIFGVKIK